MFSVLRRGHGANRERAAHTAEVVPARTIRRVFASRARDTINNDKPRGDALVSGRTRRRTDFSDFGRARIPRDAEVTDDFGGRPWRAANGLISRRVRPERTPGSYFSRRARPAEYLRSPRTGIDNSELRARRTEKRYRAPRRPGAEPGELRGTAMCKFTSAAAGSRRVTRARKALADFRDAYEVGFGRLQGGAQ